MFLSCYIRFLLNVLIMLYTFPIKCSYHVFTFPIKQMFLSFYIRFLLNVLIMLYTFPIKCSYHVIYVSY